MHSVALVAVALVAGCTVGPDYRAPEVQMPGAFDAGGKAAAGSAGGADETAQHINLATWWLSLDDAELDSLVARAVEANPDLQIAAARLGEARAQVGVVVGGSLPQAEFSAGVARGSGQNSAKGRDSQALDSGTHTNGLREITQVLGFDAAWEVDLFGRLRREIQAVRADERAAEDLRNQVLVTLVADVANGYATVRSLQLRLEIARQTVSVTEKSAVLLREKFKRGLTNELDAVLAERQLSTVRAQIAPLEAEVAGAERNVAVLLGQFPGELMAELEEPGALPTPPAEIEAGLPGELLRRRADIRAVENQLIAANARIGVAVGLLYPQITLTGGVGYQGQGLGRSPVEWDFIWSAGPAVRWEILDFGAIQSLIDVQDYRTQALLINYRRVVLTAVNEVDNGLTRYNAERRRLFELDNAVLSANRALDLATRRYERGLTDFLNVLDAQRELFDLQDQRAVSQDRVLRQFIAVCKALGGGWEGSAPVIPPANAVRERSKDGKKNSEGAE